MQCDPLEGGGGAYDFGKYPGPGGGIKTDLPRILERTILVTPPFCVEHNQEAEDKRKAKQGMIFEKLFIYIVDLFSIAVLVINTVQKYMAI